MKTRKVGNTDTERICSGCKEKKDLTRENFYFANGKYSYSCIPCAKEYHNEWRRNERAKHKKIKEKAKLIEQPPIQEEEVKTHFFRSYNFLL